MLAVHHIESSVICASHDIHIDIDSRIASLPTAPMMSNFQRELMELEACDRARAR